MQDPFYFIVCSTEFVEAGFKFFTICCKLKTTNLKLKKDLSSCDKSFFHIGPFAVQEVARAPRFVL